MNDGYLDAKAISAKLKALRLERRLSMRKLAARANVAPSFVGKIESGKASPTIMTLQRILEAMNVTVAEFFKEGGMAASDNIIFPRTGMKVLEDSERRWLYAFPSVRDIRVILSYEEFKPRTKVRETDKHKSDLFGYVIQGELSLDVPGRGKYRIRRGDAFYLKAGTEHTPGNDRRSILKMVVGQIKPERFP